ncbi:hypothetical protein [Aeromonas hydrophila]|uniref:hypothetical protein n=1 Tax=Aeromonas hydrophila TaxID=644 RepID=UPI0013DEB1F4|nr:hypothetical protein [Aeromonas hydrophila]
MKRTINWERLETIESNMITVEKVDRQRKLITMNVFEHSNQFYAVHRILHHPVYGLVNLFNEPFSKFEIIELHKYLLSKLKLEYVKPDSFTIFDIRYSLARMFDMWVLTFKYSEDLDGV